MLSKSGDDSRVLSSFSLPSRCRYSLAAKAGESAGDAAGAKIVAAAQKRTAELLARFKLWPLSLLPPTCPEECLQHSAEICAAPLKERESLLVHPDEIRRAKRRKFRRHQSHERHPHDEF